MAKDRLKVGLRTRDACRGGHALLVRSSRFSGSCIGKDRLKAGLRTSLVQKRTFPMERNRTPGCATRDGKLTTGNQPLATEI